MNRDDVVFKFTFAFKINISILISVKIIESNELKIGLYILKAKQIINFLKHADKIIIILDMTNLINGLKPKGCFLSYIYGKLLF